jgi:sialate O-acetylesterase
MKTSRLVSSFRSLVLTAAAGVFISSMALSAVDSAPLPFVSPMFGDNMVLQRGKPNTIWGWAKPGQEIRISIANTTAKTMTKDDGH